MFLKLACGHPINLPIAVALIYQGHDNEVYVDTVQVWIPIFSDIGRIAIMLFLTEYIREFSVSFMMFDKLV